MGANIIQIVVSSYSNKLDRYEQTDYIPDAPETLG